MTKFEALATFDIIGTSSLLIWGVSSIKSKIKQKIQYKRDMLQRETERKQQIEAKRIATINTNRTILWADYESEVI